MAEAPQKMHFSYEAIHQSIADAVVNRKLFEGFQPTLIVAIGGGGFIPARILRTFLKQPNGKNIPIQAIGLSLYEHEAGSEGIRDHVRKTQWLSYGNNQAAVSLQGHTILIVDEVDDTRKTLSYAVEELLKDIAEERRLWEAAHAVPRTSTPPQCPSSPQSQQQQQQREAAAAERAAAAAAWQAPRLGVFVVHNKLKAKKAELPGWMMESSYFTAADIPDHWVVYPWDSTDIYEHTRTAEGAGGPLTAAAHAHS